MNSWSLFIFFVLSNLFSSAIVSGKIETLNDLMVLDKHDLSKIKSRYPIFKENPNLFSEDQFEMIDYMDLAPSIRPLILHEQIKLFEPELLLNFAWDINDSDFSFDELEERIIRYLEQGDLPFFALKKAIKREKYHRFKMRKNLQVRENNGPFIREINSLPLNDYESNKVINAFAICIDPYRNPQERAYIAPSICNPSSEYKTPRFYEKNIKVRRERTSMFTPRSRAYDMLITAAREMAREQELSTFEKVVMAKCIAEQSIRFFEPSAHPLSALVKVYIMDRKAPEEVFFMKTGVCSNFSGLAFNIANELGLQDKIHLAQNGWHVYLEFRDEAHYYHSHPFNRQSDCDIVKY